MGAISAAIAILAALVGAGIFAYQQLNYKSVETQISPVDLRTGQSTSPSVVVTTANAGRSLPVWGSTADPDFKKWFRRTEAAFANSMEISFLARSDSEQPVVLTNLSVNIVHRTSPLPGTWIPATGAGPGPVRVLFADLDKEIPTLRYDGSWDFPLTISKSSIESFTLVAKTTKYYCRFTIDLSYIDEDGEQRKTTIDDSGRPFRLTATSRAAKTKSS